VKARLIHLNGPPGIGKSTLAQLYADEHPGTLNLDIDRLRGLIGGWRERFSETGELIRPLALGMASTHLSAGHDVVMPQYLGRLSEIQRFERVALDAGVEFREIALTETLERSIERFSQRGGDDPWHRQVRDIVDRSGGAQLLAAMHDQLTMVLRERPQATLLPSEPGAIRETYDALRAALIARQP
jgi:predicted kinase